jgi:hypothetical protein
VIRVFESYGIIKLITFEEHLKSILQTIKLVRSFFMSVDMTPTDNLNDELVYVLLNKIKHSGDERQDVSFFAADFEGKQTSHEELVGQLNHLIQSNYVMGEVEAPSNTDQSSSDSALVTCKNAGITTDGRAMLKAKYFKVDPT